MSKYLAVLISLFFLIFIFVSCSGAVVVGNSSEEPRQSNLSFQDIEIPSGATYGSLARIGEYIYSSYCVHCHDPNNPGQNAPALWGPAANLSKFGTAEDLFVFISSKMPLTSPGQLSKSNYLDLAAYILIKNEWIGPEEEFDEGLFSNIDLK